MCYAVVNVQCGPVVVQADGIGIPFVGLVYHAYAFPLGDGQDVRLREVRLLHL